MSPNTNNKQVTHHNHFVPQFYLRNWSSNGNSLWDYKLVVEDDREKTWRTTSLKTACTWNDLYTQRTAGSDVDDIENYFCDEYEAPASAILRKISSGAALSKNDINCLVDFWLIQHFRTPAYLIKNAKLTEEVFEEITNQIPDIVSNYFYEKELGIAHPVVHKPEQFNPFPVQPIEADIDFETGTITSSIVLGRASFLSSIASFVNGSVGNRVRNFNWTIVRPPREHFFLSSDNPAIAFGAYKDNKIEVDGIGLGRRNVTLVLPLTPDAALFTEVGALPFDIPEQLSVRQCELINQAIYRGAYRHIFSKKKMPNIKSNYPRVISRAIVEEDRKLRENWASSQAAAEEQHEAWLAARNGTQGSE